MRRSFGRALRGLVIVVTAVLALASLPGLAGAEDEATTTPGEEQVVEPTTVPESGTAPDGEPAGPAAEETITVVPTVDTPEDDYPAGSDALVIGDGWAPGEEVLVVITDVDGNEHLRTSVTANEGGHFELVFTLADYYVPRYDVVASASSGVATTSFTDLGIVLTNNATAAGDRLYFPGETLKATASSDFADAPNWYKFRVRQPNNSQVYLSSGCLTKAQALAGETYTLPANAMLSTGSLWKVEAAQYSNNTCTSVVKDPYTSASFPVTKSFAFASATPGRDDCHVDGTTFQPTSGCSDAAATFAPGATAYVRVLGFRPGVAEVSATWRDPSNNIECKNTTSVPAGDRPDTNSVGELDTQYVPVLPEVPDVSPACNATTSADQGDWSLELAHSTIDASQRYAAVFSVGNNPPVAGDDDASGTEDTQVVVSKASLLTNDTDGGDGGALSVTAASNPSGGTVAIDGDNVEFDPTSNLCGDDAASFEYTVSDTFGTDTGLVTIDLTCVNDPPVAGDDDASGTEDTVLTIAKATLLADDDDGGDGGALSVTAVSNPLPSGSGVVIDGTDVKFTPKANLCGDDVASFEYTVSDGPDTDTGLVTIDLTCVDDAPALTLPATASGQYSDNLATVNISATDVDTAGTDLDFSIDPSACVAGVGLPPSLSLTDAGDGTATITGQLTQKTGTYNVCVVVSDGTTDVSGIIAITINKEDATVTPWSTNPAAIQVGSGGTIPANALTLKFDVKEKVPDLPAALALAGDINLAGLTVKLTPLATGTNYTLTCTDTATGSGYNKIKTFTCKNPVAIAVNTYEVEAAIACLSGNCYYGGTGWDAFTAYDPTLGFATGGGYLMRPTKNGPDEKMNFGFTMKYNKSGANLQGQFIAIRHHADGTVSRLKSNSLGGLVLTQANSCGVATFNGKSTFTTWDPAANGGLGAYVSSGNNSFSVYAEDCNNPGTGVDSLWLFAPGSLNMSTPAGTVTTDKRPLSGGNIAVPHRLR